MCLLGCNLSSTSAFSCLFKLQCDVQKLQSAVYYLYIIYFYLYMYICVHTADDGLWSGTSCLFFGAYFLISMVFR